MTALRARGLLNLLLLTLACGLALVVWFTARAPQPAHARLTSLDIDRVSLVRIERRGHAGLTFRRLDAGWRLTEPVDRPADEIRVRALLGLGRARVHEAFTAAGYELSGFGLKPPVARVWFDDLEFRFGDTDPLNGWRYVLVGSDVHLITDAFFHHLLATLPAFVDPALVTAGEPLTAVRVSESVLNMLGEADPPGSAGGRAGHIDATHLAAWSEARASGVRPLDPALPWVDGVEIAFGSHKTLRLLVADGDHELLFARRDWGLQYHLPREPARRLLINPPET